MEISTNIRNEWKIQQNICRRIFERFKKFVIFSYVFVVVLKGNSGRRKPLKNSRMIPKMYFKKYS